MFNLTKTQTIKTRTANLWRSAAVPLAFLALSITPAILKAQNVSLANLTVLETGPIHPVGVAADSKGDVFISDYNNGNIVEVLPDGETKIVANTTASGFVPFDLAVDAGGNLFISDPAHGRVVKLTQDGVQSIVTTGINNPMGIAVDTAGNLFVSDFGVKPHQTDARALRVSPGGVQTVLAVGGLIPEQVAVDGAGNAYFVGQVSGYDYGVVKVPAQSNAGTKVYDRNDGTYLTGVGVDGNGNLFIADELSDSGPGRLWKVPALGGTPLIVAQGLSQPREVAVDGLGNVFVGDATSGSVSKLQTPLNFGRVNVCSAGQTTSCSSTLPLIYNVTAPGTLGVPKMAGAGLPNPEFAIASGTTCQGTLGSGVQCTVNVTFTPRAPGLRRDAVSLVDANGNVLLTTYVYGQGVAPVLAFGQGAGSTFASVPTPYGMAFDIAGNLYVANTSGHTVLKMAPNGTTSTIATGLSQPVGVAVDALGNVFIADTGNTSIVEIPANGGPQATVASGLSSPQSVAVDGAGNLYIADTLNNRVLKVASGNIEIIGSGPVGFETGIQWWRPNVIAIDASGNIYVSQGGPQIIKIALDGTRTGVGNNLLNPLSIAVDAAGNLYVAQSGTAGVVQIAPDGSQTTLASTFGVLNGVAVDASGNLFLSQANPGSAQNAVVKWQRSQAALNFAAPQAIGSVGAPMQVTVENLGNAPLALGSLTMPANFEQVSGPGGPADCTANESLAPATDCNISISFAPAVSGSLTGTFAVAGGAGSAQKVSLSGTASLDPQTIHFDPATVFTTPYSPVQGSFYTLNGTASSGLPVYYSILTPSICPGSGSTLQFPHGGTCTITAYQPGNKVYQPAASITVSFYVYYSQTIIFNAFGTVPAVGTGFALNGTSPTYGASGIPVVFTSLTPSTCSVSGAVAQALAPGTCTIQANQAGNAQYAPAPPVSVNFMIKAAQ